MFSSLTNILWTSIDAVFDFLDKIFSSVGLGFLEFIVGIAILYALFKYILSPYLSGSGSSDTAKKSKKKG